MLTSHGDDAEKSEMGCAASSNYTQDAPKQWKRRWRISLGVQDYLLDMKRLMCLSETLFQYNANSKATAIGFWHLRWAQSEYIWKAAPQFSNNMFRHSFFLIQSHAVVDHDAQNAHAERFSQAHVSTTENYLLQLDTELLDSLCTARRDTSR